MLIGEVARYNATIVLQPLRGVPNIHLLRQKPYSMLPEYCRGFDVRIIPFRKNDLTVRANPLKLQEYLVAGLPVVPTPLPEVARYDGLVHLADGVEAFLEGITSVLAADSGAMAWRRVEAMRAEGWEARVAEMSTIIAQHLGGAR